MDDRNIALEAWEILGAIIALILIVGYHRDDSGNATLSAPEKHVSMSLNNLLFGK